jgi:hypothetical protein
VTSPRLAARAAVGGRVGRGLAPISNLLTARHGGHGRLLAKQDGRSAREREKRGEKLWAMPLTFLVLSMQLGR